MDGHAWTRSEKQRKEDHRATMFSLKRARLAIEQKKIELSEQDLKLREDEITLRKKDHEINVGRDSRERWLFIFAIGALLVSAASLWLAGLAVKISCLPK
jgi:Flp pilus assembly protein TadB